MATERKIPEIGEEVHLPGLSAQPLMLAVGTTIMLLGLTQPNPIFFIVGLVVFTITMYLWIRDAVAEYKALPESHGDHGHDDHGHDDGHGHAEEPAAAPAAPDAH